MVPEAPLEQTDVGLVPAGEGWFVVNARDARWVRREGRGVNVPLTGWTAHEAETWFPQLGVNVIVVDPGEPTTMYHHEADAEALLVLAGEALLLVEGQERPLRRWDFVHLPPGTGHAVVGAGDGPCTILAIGARAHIEEDCNGGAYVPDPAAARHGAAVEAETPDPGVAYARFPAPAPTRYPDGALPGD